MNTQTSGGSRRRGVAGTVVGLGMVVLASHMSSVAAAPSSTATVVVMQQPGAAGSLIKAGDVTTRVVSEADLTGAASGLQQVIGQRLVVALPRGALVQLTELGRSQTNHRLVAVDIDSPSLPSGLEVGSNVDIVRGSDGRVAAAALGAGTVIDLAKATAGSRVTVTLDVDATLALAVAELPGGAVVRLLRVSS